MTKKVKPIVAIVGRPNVGKSTLFNQIGKCRLSIVNDMAGITRDRIYMNATWLEHEFTLIDTGGIEIRTINEMSIKVRIQTQIATEEADVIIFLVDGRAGLMTGDEDIAKLLRATNKPIILAVNKIDQPQQQIELYEFYSLGIGEPIGISASNSLNLGDLLDAVVEKFSEVPVTDYNEDEIKVAVIGRPNVGKSSLVNALIGEDRVIVSEIPGTTRDAIDTHFSKDGINFILIDTAGMRRKSKIEDSIERYSVIHSLRAIERADIVLMLLEAPSGITEQDKKIAGYAHDSGKGCILVVNKWDIFPNKNNRSTKIFTDNLSNQLSFLQYAPVIYVSALTKQRINRLPELIKFVAERQSMRIQTSVLNELIRDAIDVNPPPSRRSRQPKFFFATQTGICPPKFVIFVNEPQLLHFSYLRFLENRLRESFGFDGTPLKFILRKHDEKFEE